MTNSAGYQSPGLPVEAPPRPLLQHYGAALIFEGDYMLPSWALPLSWLLLMLAIGCILAVLFTGCQMPMR